MSENETPKVLEPSKPSKLKKIASGAATAAWIAVPTAALGGSIYFSYKMGLMQLETAKLNLETAKLKKS